MERLWSGRFKWVEPLLVNMYTSTTCSWSESRRLNRLLHRVHLVRRVSGHPSGLKTRPVKGRRVLRCDKAGHPLTLSYPELLVSQGQSSNLQPELDRNNFWTLPIIAKNQNLIGARQPDDGDNDDDDDDKCTFSI